MAISSIQPITNFSMVLPATFVSPPELLSVASDLVTTPSASAIVTLGTAEPASQPLFNAAGLIESPNSGLFGFPTNGISLAAPGSVAQTPQSQALAGELFDALNNSSATGFGSALAAALAQNGTTPAANLNSLVNANLDLAALGLNSTDATTSTLNGSLAANVQLALAGIGTGANTTTAVGTPGQAATTVNGIVAATTVTATPATTTIATPAAATPATVTPATVTPATVTPATVAPATVTPATVTPAVAAPATVAAATATAAAATPAVTTTAAAPATPAPVFGNTPAEVLQRLVADVTGRAIANLMDPGFAATAAGLFVSAAVFRASAVTSAMVAAEIAGTPAPPVTPVEAATAV